MDKALRMGRDSTTGSFQLFVGKTVSTVIMAVGAIILGLFILESDYGLYAIALIPATTMLLFQDWGVSSALTKYCAQYRAAGNEGDLRRIVVSGLTFEVATGLSLTVLSLFTANFLASVVFGRPESAFLITLASVAILSTALYTASQSVFVGFERMELSSYTMICQAVAYCMFVPTLVYLGYGALGAVLGYTISILITGVAAVTMLYLAIFRKLGANTADRLSVSQTLKPLLNFGVPLAIASIISGLLLQLYSFIMASTVDLAMIGNYRVANNFAVLLTFFTFPISTVLFPTFSKLNPKDEPELVKTVFTSSVKYTALFLVPATMAMMVLSKPIIGTLYGNRWSYAPLFLALYVTSNLFAVFGNLSMASLFQALGETRTLMKLNILTLAIGAPTAFFLIPQLGIIGVILVSILAAVPSTFIGIYWAWKRYGTKADLQSSARILLASTIASAIAYATLSVLSTAEWIRLVAAGVLFLATYLTAAPLIGAINQTDVNNLRAMFSGLGPVSKLIEIPLKLVEKPLRTRAPNTKVTEQ
jgi:lipopolysaccharide exporter